MNAVGTEDGSSWIAASAVTSRQNVELLRVLSRRFYLNEAETFLLQGCFPLCKPLGNIKIFLSLVAEQSRWTRKPR
jgi:hypothetical protein